LTIWNLGFDYLGFEYFEFGVALSLLKGI
jgi:hypothetical protein